jgi:gliding motility-associated lipoprotein GldH
MNKIILHNLYSPLLFAFLLFASVSCVDSDIVTFETHKIPKESWNIKDTIVFRTEINDIFSYYDISLDIRNSGEYPYSNFYMFLTMLYPDSSKTTDTIENILADDNGKWLGRGLGDIKDNRFIFKKGIKFSSKGLYTFKFVQAMRVFDLKGISDIGLRIEKEKN